MRLKPNVLIPAALAVLTGLAVVWTHAAAPPARKPAPKRRVSPEEKLARQVAEAKAAAINRFAELRTPSPWQKLLVRKLGPLKLQNVPTAKATEAVAAKLGLKLKVAPGVAGTVTYDKSGTLEDFTREGLNPRYWYLALKGDTLHLKPHVAASAGTISSARGQAFNAKPETMDAVTARCGGLKAYRERFSSDPAGAVTIRGRVWFIDKVKRHLNITD